MPTATQTISSLRDLGFLDVEEVANLVGAKPLTLRNWRSKGIGPAWTRASGKRVVYSLSAVQEWLASRTVRPAEEPTLTNPGKQKSRRRPH